MRLLIVTLLVVCTLGLAARWLFVEVRHGSHPVPPLGAKPALADRARQEFLRHDPLVLVAAVVAVVWALAFVLGSPVKGIADNGDWERLMYQLHLAPSAGDPLTSGHLNQHLVHVASRSDLPIPPDVAGSSSLFNYYFNYLSSQLGLVKVAMYLHDLTGSRVIDIRWIGFTNLLPLFLGFGAVIVWSRRLRPLVRRTVVILAAFAFFDPGYLLYLNSMYSESATLGFFVLMVGAGFAVGQCRAPRQAFWVFILAAVCFALAKADNAFAILPIAIAAVFLAARAYGGGWHSRPRQFAASIGVVALVGAAVWDLSASLEYFTHIHEYDAVFVGILPHTADKAAALKALGLPASLVKYSGYAAFDRDHSAFALSFINDEFYRHISMGKVAVYYLQHPGALWSAISYGSGSAPSLHLDYLSNVTTGAGYAPHTPWSVLHDHRFPHNPAILLVPIGAIVFAGRRLFRARRSTPESWLLLAAIGVAALVSFVQAPLIEGTEELEKHEFLFNVCFDVCLIGLVALGLSLLVERISPAALELHKDTPAPAKPAEPVPAQSVPEQTAGADAGSPGPQEPPGRTAMIGPPTSAAEGVRARILCPVCEATVPVDPRADSRGRKVVACPDCGNIIVLAESSRP